MTLSVSSITDTKVSVVGIDPGSNACGFAVVEVDVLLGHISIQTAVTVTRKRALTLANAPLDGWGERTVANIGYSNYLYNMLHEFNPCAVVYESSYAQQLNAFKALSQQTSMFTVSCYKFYPDLILESVSPSRVKSQMGVDGGSDDKELMRVALASLNLPGVDLATLDEHAIDAICIALTKVREILS